MIEYVYMEYFKSADGLYYVFRRDKNGKEDKTPFGWYGEGAAISYIAAHGLQPVKR